MELGISAGAGVRKRRGDLPGGVDSPTRADLPGRAASEHILALADQAGYGAALINAGPGGPGHPAGPGEGCVITWPQFAHMVRAAARGLARRGLREADTAGIFVQDAVSHVVAVHAVRAAGAIAAPVGPARSAADIAAQLKRDRARLLITSAGLAELAIAAAERSWVRQVFAFGEADGTTPFGSLMHTARHGRLQAEDSGRADGSEHLDGAHNGSSGRHAAAHVRDLDGSEVDRSEVDRSEVDGSGLDGLGLDGLGLDGLGLDGLGLDGLGLDGATPRLTRRDTVVAAPPCGDPDTYTLLLDLVLAAGATVVAAPLPQVAAVVSAYEGTAVIVPGGTDVPGRPATRVFTVD